MSDEDVVTPESSTGSGEAESPAPGSASATDSLDEPRIPRSRLNEVISERNALREKIAALEAKAAAHDDPPEPEQAEPPAGASELDRARWLIEKYSAPVAKKAIERELGMSLAEAKAKLSKAESVGKTAARLRWESECAAAGLDPDSEDVQMIAAGVNYKNPDASIKDILKVAAKFVKPQVKPSARVETESLGGVVRTSDWLPRDAQDAARGAAEGKRAKQLSTVEIIAASKK